MMKRANCSSCRAAIIWTVSSNGKPVRADSGGSIELLDAGDAVRADVVPKEERARVPSRALYVSHFVTCPNANKHRSKGKSVSL
jgi:hypothetical protein